MLLPFSTSIWTQNALKAHVEIISHFKLPSILSPFDSAGTWNFLFWKKPIPFGLDGAEQLGTIKKRLSPRDGETSQQGRRKHKPLWSRRETELKEPLAAPGSIQTWS